MKEKEITLCFVGNPNCGKTTLFNAFTGANLKVANWPGVTVERVEGETSYEGRKLKLVDTPGIYSLTSYTMEEIVTRNCILYENVDVIINVVDASCLERNLYLTTQLLEMGKPVILALNMMDIVQARGMELDLHRLPEMLGGIPVIPVSARKRTGLKTLLHAAVHHYEEGPHDKVVIYSKGLENKIEKLEELLSEKYQDVPNKRWAAVKLLERDEEVHKQYPIEAPEILDRNYEKTIINEKYDYIEEVVKECLFHKGEKGAFTEKIDGVLTHPIWGMPIFFLIMALVFFLTFTVGDFLKGYFQMGLDWFSGAAEEALIGIDVSSWLISLVVDGIISGVGGILTFLPNIFILFVALALLEDSGYMARVAYVMNELMAKVGLSGKAFLPMVLGFGCTVPAVMASRALPSDRDRKRTILITPFMSCSARLPIYVLFADMFFGKSAMVAAFSLYLIGILVAVSVAFFVEKLRPSKEENALLIELPEYKLPSLYTMAIYVWEKVKDYLTKAGTVIFIASILLWFLLNYNGNGMAADVSESFGAMIGRLAVPLLAPAGLGMWQIAVALICGISAKEVVVSSFSVLFGIANINSQEGMAQLLGLLGQNGFTALNAYCLMLFCLLYTPCVATIGTIHRETRSWKWTFGMIFFQLFLAWAVAVLVFQIGSLF